MLTACDFLRLREHQKKLHVENICSQRISSMINQLAKNCKTNERKISEIITVSLREMEDQLEAVENSLCSDIPNYYVNFHLESFA